ncbi:phospholipase/carboxylesterase [Tersicoccus solisilvae]|uniref:Phospholipase/carboxylesterase n=1 Tax=Tersicoccus solisilvae TaxID=1882339 RepID=A0ABQ1PLF4_9MICC|nr:phospholipase/carboxylesterase [Tersicoccus solisilvae]
MARVTSPDLSVWWSAPAAERAGTPLVILLHGYGADERDLAALVPFLPSGITYAAVRAPHRMDPGFSWFDLQFDDAGSAVGYSTSIAIDACRALFSWLDGVRGDFASVSLLGFSQGMAVATSMLRHAPDDFAVVVGCSGFVLVEDGNIDAPADGYFNDAALAARRPPMFWGRDQQDDVIPAPLAEQTAGWLREKVDLMKVLYAGMGHGINEQELRHVSEFLTHHLLR